MSTETVKILNPEEVSVAQAQGDKIAASANHVVSDKTFVFFGAFEGTNNTKYDLDCSHDKFKTAVGELSDRIDEAGSGNVKVGYYPGVGTPGTEPDSFVFPSVQAIATAKQAYDHFAKAATDWLKDNPEGSVTVMLTAFSRGIVAAAVFSQMLYEKGLVDPRNPDVPLIPPGQVGVSAGLVISPVHTGALGNNLAFPPNVQNIKVVLADNEYRTGYIQAVYDQPGIETFRVTGNHGDVGSIYDNGLGAIYLEDYTEFFQKSGLVIADVPPERQFDPSEVVIHDEAWDPKNFWNLHYGSIEEGTEIRTVLTGHPATMDGNESTFTLYSGAEVKITLGDNLPAVEQAKLDAAAEDDQILPEPDPQTELAATFLDLDPELWAAMTQIAAAAQKVEQVGDDVTALIQAFQQGNDWDAFESTVNLIKSLDTVAGLSESYKTLSGEVSSDIQGMSSLVNAIGDLIRLEQALQDGDDWAIALSATAMIDNGITAYNHLNGTPGANGAAYSGAAASIVGLGLSVKQMADAFDDGDAIARMQATLSVVQSGLSTYVAVSEAVSAMTTGTAVATGAAQTVGDALPAIGCAIGVAQGVLAIADGDEQGGTEQIGLAVATYVLIGCGPYGWIVALALQLASATRNCDGQIIDTENIEEFTDNIAPAGDEAAHAAIVSIEKPAEWGTDIWGSLYISQSVVATIADFHKDEPPQESVRFTQSDNGQLAISVVGDKSMRAAAESYGSTDDTTLLSRMADSAASEWRMAA